MAHPSRQRCTGVRCPAVCKWQQPEAGALPPSLSPSLLLPPCVSGCKVCEMCSVHQTLTHHHLSECLAWRCGRPVDMNMNISACCRWFIGEARPRCLSVFLCARTRTSSCEVLVVLRSRKQYLNKLLTFCFCSLCCWVCLFSRFSDVVAAAEEHLRLNYHTAEACEKEEHLSCVLAAFCDGSSIM